MVKLTDLQTQQSSTINQSDSFELLGGEDAGWARSMLAAIPSGIFKIFEGAATLGATLLDLGVDKDRAEAVEQWFADVNPFDEAAGATGIGKITELIVNIGVPGGLAFKAASGLGRATIAAQKAGKYVSTGEKARRFGQGMLGAGAAEAAFVGDVEDAGTFGDFLGGPTELERDVGDPQTELLNRLKFGIEGAAFTGAFGAIGKGIGKIRSSSGTSKAITGDTDFQRSLNKGLDKVGGWLRSRGFLVQEGYDAKMKRIGAEAVDTNFAETAMRDLDNISEKLARNYKKVGVDKVDTVTVKNDLLKEMNDVLISGSAKGGKMKPIFGLVDEIAEDTTIGQPFRTGSGVLSKLKPGSLLPRTAKLPDKLVKGKFNTVNTKTGKQIYNVQIDRMDDKKVAALRKLLKNKYKADPEQIKDLLSTFVAARSRWGELFTSMGRRFNPDALKQFEEMLPKYLNDVVDRGYNVFKNNKGQWSVAQNYRPTKEIIKEAVKDFKEVAAKKGLKLNDELAEQMVREVWEGASLPQGFKIGETVSPGDVRFKSLPDFMKKSVADNITQKKIAGMDTAKMSELTGVAKPIIQKLLGKSKNPMSTIVEGTNNLSSQVRSNEFFDNLIIKNNALKKRYDDWLNTGKVGPEPRIPFLYNNTGEARKYAGGTASDFTMIGGKQAEAAQAIKLDKWIDPKGTLKDIDTTRTLAKKAAGEEVDKILNPLNGKVALNDYAESFMKVQNASKSIPQQLYNNLILYPKGVSQMAKTILAPFTHVRNFISASAFAAANGILPFGKTADVKAAWNALQVLGPGTRKSNQFYQELLDLGVVNSQVQLGDLRRLLEDVDFGNTLNKLNSDYGLNKLLKRLSKIKKGAQDAYTAEDDFWKIFTFLGEKSRLDKSFRNAGLRLGQEFTDMNGATRIFNDQTLKEMSADLVKNNVPNYAMVSEFVKGLRKLPVGNFVAFPAEIIRTSTNIVETALKEINYTTVINGKTVRPLRARGLQRLTGMALTTAALPLGTVAAMQAIYNVADEEIDAMRRYVADWSKNSVLIPFKDDAGKLSYIDFSHLNAYDTVTRPIQTIVNAVNEGRADEDGLVDDFILGMIESTKELGEPFISESIWTEALQDVAPILGRGGRDSTGRQIWNPADSLGDKMYKGIAHLVEAQAPLNWKQLGRLGISMFPVDSQGRFDERGNEYEFGNEAAGIFGLRKVEVNPEKSFNYKITDYKKGIRNSRNLFTQATLKGGPVTPEDIVDAYINSNRALYETNREIYEDIKAAQILGMSSDAIDSNMTNRGERKAFNSLIEAEFRPLKISKDVRELFEIKAANLGITNPYDAAEEVMDRIKEVLEAVPLDADFFPNLDNPFSQLPGAETISNIINTPPLPPLPNPNLATGIQFGGNVLTGVNQADRFAALFPNDELGQLATNKKNRNRIV